VERGREVEMEIEERWKEGRKGRAKAGKSIETETGTGYCTTKGEREKGKDGSRYGKKGGKKCEIWIWIGIWGEEGRYHDIKRTRSGKGKSSSPWNCHRSYTIHFTAIQNPGLNSANALASKVPLNLLVLEFSDAALRCNDMLGAIGDPPLKNCDP
jgi:hypothetical protein